jgi:prepilin-type processing-associated H-X9-DG protein
MNCEWYKKTDYIPRLNGSASANAKLRCPEAANLQFSSTARIYALNNFLTGPKSGSPPNVSYGNGKQHPYPAEMNDYYKIVSSAWDFGPPGGGGDYWYGAKLVKFGNPSTKVMLLESDRSDTVGGNDVITLNGPTGGYPAWSGGGAPGAYSFRHPNLRMNVAYMDGHVESVLFGPGVVHTRFFDPAK